MGLLKRFSRSRSSEKFQSNKQHPSQAANEPGMLGRLPKFRSKSKGSGIDSKTSEPTVSPPTNGNWNSESHSLHRKPIGSVSSNFGEPSSTLSNLQSLTLQPSRSSSGFHSLEHNPDTSFDQPVIHQAPSQQSGRPLLPTAPKPPLIQQEKRKSPPIPPVNDKAVHPDQSLQGSSKDAFNGSPEAQRFDKPLIIEIPKIVCERCRDACTVEALKINNVYYHPHCFVCSACNVQLSNSPYFAKDGGIYCSKDFNALFGTKCRSCKNYIQGDVVAVLGFTYHPACFNCSRCGKSFEAGQEVIIDKDETYCENCPSEIITDDLLQQNSMFCSGCKALIADMSKSLCALEGNWHPQCLKCHACQNLLTKEYFVHGRNIYCEKDYLKQFGVKCNNCGEYIVGKVIEAGSKRYHPTCAVCSVCSGIFAEGQDMLVHGDEVWHPGCNSRHSNKSRSTVNDSSFHDSSIYTTDDLNISDDLNSINVVTLDYSVPDELLSHFETPTTERNSSISNRNPSFDQLSKSPMPKTPPAIKPKPSKTPDLYENIEIPYLKFPNRSASTAIPQNSGSSQFISLSPELRPPLHHKSQPFPTTASLYDIPYGDDAPDFIPETPATTPYSNVTLETADSILNMPRSRSFDRNKKSSVPFAAPVMSENMFRSKSNDRLRVFQPKGSDAYIGGYLNPADPSDLAPGLFHRFPSLKKQQSYDKHRQRQSSFSQPPKAPENVSTRPGNLNNRGNYQRSGSLVSQTEPFKYQRSISQASRLKDDVMQTATYEAPRSKSSFDLGNRARRVNSDDYTENSAKCFYDKERASKSSRLGLAFRTTPEEDTVTSKFDQHLQKSSIGKEYLQKTKEKTAKEKFEDNLKVSDDPRSASRDPSALLPPQNPLRYKNPYQASPSRILGYIEIDDESDEAEHTSELAEVFRSRNKKQTVKPHRERQISAGATTTDDSGLDCFSEPEGNRKSTSTSRLLDSHKGYRSDFEPAETSRKQRKSNERRAKLLHDNFINYMKAVKHGHVTGYASEDNLDDADTLSALSEAPFPSTTSAREVKIYRLNQIQTTNRRLPRDVKRKHLEVHLSEQEFYVTFQMSRGAFYQLPIWKRNILKKFNYLF